MRFASQIFAIVTKYLKQMTNSTILWIEYKKFWEQTDKIQYIQKTDEITNI